MQHILHIDSSIMRMWYYTYNINLFPRIFHSYMTNYYVYILYVDIIQAFNQSTISSS